MGPKCALICCMLYWSSLHPFSKSVVYAETSKPNGRIIGSLARTICLSTAYFAQSNTVVPPLKKPGLFAGTKFDDAQECKVFQRSKCGAEQGCPFQSAQCPNSESLTAKTATLRISGGHVAIRNQFPHQVRIRLTKTRKICGGSIYSATFVVSAASCFPAEATSGDIIVVTGDHRQTFNDPNEQNIRSVNIYIHPEYDANTGLNDIALVKVNPVIRFSVQNKPAKLEFMDGDWTRPQLVEISGWGSMSSLSNDSTEVLQTAILFSYPIEDCVKDYEPLGKQVLPGKHLCARAQYVGVCAGDLGGPLTLTLKDGAYVVGIISSLNTCDNKGALPVVFTHYSAYLYWIKTIAE